MKVGLRMASLWIKPLTGTCSKGALLSLSISILAIDVEAHSGGLDTNGCHAGSQPYHCHRSSTEMVGNRLRCDLGSKSKECVQSTTSVSSAELTSVTSQEAANNRTVTSTPNLSSDKAWRLDVRNTFRLKNPECVDGKRMVDALNRGAIKNRLVWTFWIEDEDGDSLGSVNRSMYFDAKERASILMWEDCNVPLSRIKSSFKVF